jgi:hypothetical protein
MEPRNAGKFGAKSSRAKCQTDETVFFEVSREVLLEEVFSSAAPEDLSVRRFYFAGSRGAGRECSCARPGRAFAFT